MRTKNYLLSIIYSLLLIAFTVFIMMDTFVIARVYKVVESDGAPASDSSELPDNANTSSEPAETIDTEPDWVIVTDDSYTDENIMITLAKYHEYESDIYVADVQLSSAAYLQTAFAKESYGKNVTEKTSVTADYHNAILAINGDYYGARNSGYVIRNGSLYRDTATANQEDLVIRENGSFSVITESYVSADDLLADGAEHVLSFGPALVLNQQNVVNDSRETAGHATVKNPRTAVGIIDELHYVFVVVDGRSAQSRGVTLYELAAFMDYLCVTTAYNLDGGGSATMYFNGELINKPTTDGQTFVERSVSDIVYIGY